MVDTGGAASRLGPAATTSESSVCTFAESERSCADRGKAPATAATIAVTMICLQDIM